MMVTYSPYPQINNNAEFLFQRATAHCNVPMLYISHQFLQFPLIKYILTHKALPAHQLSPDASICHLSINYHIKMAAWLFRNHNLVPVIPKFP